MRTLHLIAYDTPDQRRRQRLAKLLSGYGERVQDSVFECWLTASQRQALTARLNRVANTQHDAIRIYTLCGKDVADVQLAGTGGPPADADAPVI